MSFSEIKRNYPDNLNALKNKKIKTNFLLQKDCIKYVLVPSLESIGIINVAAELCQQSDIKDAIRHYSTVFEIGGQGQFRCELLDGSFIQLENDVLDKLSVVPLPNLLKAKVANVIRPLLLQILDWICYDCRHIEYNDSIYFTNEGTIDVAKTFQQLVIKDSVDYIADLFELACRYCLEDSIRELWDKLPKRAHNYYLYSKEEYKKYENHFVAYWTCVVKNKLSRWFRMILPNDYRNMYHYYNSVYKNMFKLAISEGNISAVKYFWNKLSPEEIFCNLGQWIHDAMRNRKNCGLECPSIIKHSSVLYFLLSQVKSAENQRQVFLKHSKIIIFSLYLDWPWQRFLLPTLQRIWSSLNEEIYMEFLIKVVRDINVTNQAAQKLLRELWCDSPIRLKKFFIQELTKDRFIAADIFFKLLTEESIGTVKLMLNFATVEQKEQIIFSLVESDQCLDAIYVDKLSLFDVLIEETLSSELAIDKLKVKIIVTWGTQLCSELVINDYWEMLRDFFVWVFTSIDQMDALEIETMNEVEKFHSKINKYELLDKFVSTDDEFTDSDYDYYESA